MEYLLAEAKACIEKEDYKNALQAYNKFIDYLDPPLSEVEIPEIDDIVDDYISILIKLNDLDISDNNPYLMALDEIFSSIRRKRLFRKPLTEEEKNVSNMCSYGLDSQILYGKYNGCTIGELMIDDPSYLLWSIRNIDHFALENKCLLFPQFRKYYITHKKIFTLNILKNIAIIEHLAGSDENYEADSDYYEVGPELYGYDSWDEMVFRDGFDGDIDSYQHYKDYS